MHERWRAARLSLQLPAPRVAWCLFRRRVSLRSVTRRATSIHIARELTRTMPAEEFIPFVRGLIVISLILTMIGGFQLPLACIGGSSFNGRPPQHGILAVMRQLNFGRRPVRCRRG